MKKFFVVSLPRTGTKSLCKMAKICGLRIKHVPGFNYKGSLNNFDFFSDTPCYRPSFVEEMCNNDDFDANFIYIEKDFEKIFDSWNKVGLYRNYKKMYEDYVNKEKKMEMRYSMVYDVESYDESFSKTFMNEANYNDVFHKHKESIIDIIKKYNKNLLVYKFSDEWKPFCDFIGCEEQTSDLPYINKNTMFEKID